jgi:RNA 3'-terminal phosphate cyclase-like protein
MPSTTLKLDDGAVQFRQRLVVALFSNRLILIRNIHADNLQAPDLQAEEASFLRLIDRLTNGTTIEINATGTRLRLKPGILMGGQVEHDCPETRNVGWFLEGILPLAPFLRVGKHASTRTRTFFFCHVKPTLRATVHRYMHRREGDPMRLPGL